MSVYTYLDDIVYGLSMLVSLFVCCVRKRCVRQGMSCSIVYKLADNYVGSDHWLYRRYRQELRSSGQSRASAVCGLISSS